MTKKIAKELTAQEIVSKGEHIDDWPCDYNLEREIEDNGSCENVYKYKEKWYCVYSEFPKGEGKLSDYFCETKE
jgi:hypothetical protein